MKQIKVYHYNSFTTSPVKGNPAGIVLDTEHLTEQEMQEIARKAGFTETTFILPSTRADWRLRYFTPGHEMNLCGHGTIASLYTLHTKGIIPQNQGNQHSAMEQSRNLLIETNAGILPMTITAAEDGTPFITMSQASPQFIPFQGSVEKLASCMGLTVDDIDPNLPILYGSTGIWTLLVPIRGLEPFNRMVPHTQRFPEILEEMPRASLHPFCLETYDSTASMHARHFSSAFSGTIEDPVTGTASGVMGAYYSKYIRSEAERDQPLTILIEQGFEIGRDGRVLVTVKPGEEKTDVSIAGTAVFADEMLITLD